MEEIVRSTTIPGFSGYHVLERLYSGSRTEVYRAVRDGNLASSERSQPVVIKLLKRQYPTIAELVQFRNQYAIAKNLDIPGIIQPYSLEPYHNSYALVMEDFGGISLREWVRQRGDGGDRGGVASSSPPSPSSLSSLPLSDFFSIALQIIDILHQLHQQRVVHKDLKPANILIHPETQQIKLIDFSIASLLPRETQEVQSSGGLEGTLAYLSPEQTGRMNRGIDYRSDFYSLGVTFFELLTGQLPFQSDDPMELVHCHIAKQPPSVCDLNPELPLMLGKIICKLMAKNAEERYQGAIGLQYDLWRCQKLEQEQELGQELGQAQRQPIEFELGQHDISDRFLIPEKLYGRESEVQTLLESFERVANGAAELLLVAGFSGIGKTAVVNEVHKPIARGARIANVRWNGYFIKGKYDQFNRNIPLSAFVQAFRDLMGQLLSESDQQLVQWKDKILLALGENAQVLIEMMPELEQIIGKQPAVPELSGSAAQNRFNLLFQKFIAVFSTLEHPLVMFLDDLQWADSASLNLIQVLMSQQEAGYLFIIGAYRDNEVFPAHALMLMLGELAKAEAKVNTLTLKPLIQADINHLIAEALSCAIELALPLTELVYQKTQGNPFFTTQFLKALHHEGYITFDPQVGYWQCDMVAVRSLLLTDDVVEFMALQLQKLPSEAQTMLKLAACIGAQFDLSTLAIVSEQSQTAVAIALWRALQDGLILPISETYKFFQGVDTETSPSEIVVPYKFLHDRVQQAAYTLIPEDQKQTTHLAIGRLLLQNTSDPEANLFEIVNHWNIAIDLINNSTEKTQLAQLNWLAGRKAKVSVAYEPALQYFKTGLALLAADSWQTQYELTLNLHEGAARTAFVYGDYLQMEQWSAIVLQQGKTVLDKVKIYDIQIQAQMAQAQPAVAIQIALTALKLLDIALPEAPTSAEIQNQLQQTKALWAHQDISRLADLPLMRDPEKLAAIIILSSIFAPAFAAKPELLPLIACQQIQLSIQHGNCEQSAFGYSNYSAILNMLCHDLDASYQFGQLAIHLVEKLNAKEVKSRTFNQAAIFSMHGKVHLRQAAPILQEGCQHGVENGDLEFAGYAAYNWSQYSYFSGLNLISLQQGAQTYELLLNQINQKISLNYNQLVHQAALNLLGQSEDPCRLSGTAFDEQAALQHFLNNQIFSGVQYLFLHKIVLCCLFAKFEHVLDYVDWAERYLSASTGMVVVPLFRFFATLAKLQVYATQSTQVQPELLLQIEQGIKEIRRWAEQAPMNFQHKVDLITAERSRVLGEKGTAIDFYDRAISLARANDYIQEAALANELAAKFYLDWGKERIAQDYLIEAYYGYTRWGAKAKVADLERRYPQLLAPILQQSRAALSVNETVFTSATATSNSSSSSISDSLDLAAVLKTSQTLSSEIELDKLLSTLLHTVIQTAGASKCVLMLHEDQALTVQAIAELNAANQIEAQVQPAPVPVQDSHEVPISLINSVKRSLQAVVIIDAIVHPQFATDVYIHTHQIKSILCSPILHQGKLLGMVYLENNLTTGAFTRDRVELLNLLCSQAAISLENAHLYGRSQQYAQQLEQKTQALEEALSDLQNAQLQIVQSEKMSALGNLVAGVAHEINNPVGFIAGNLQPALDYVKDIFGLIELYQAEYLNTSTVIQEKIDAIDLEYIREDLPKLINSMQLGVNRIRDISTSLRTFSRADKDYKVPFNIHEGIDSTILILKHRLKASDDRPAIEVVTEYGNLPPIECFPGQLNQVFMNILANAIDALEEASQNRSFADLKANPNWIEVKTQLNEAGKQVVIQIRDNGIGMSEATKQRVFDHLFTTKGVGKGTGLGLAIARKIVVEKHGGTIAVESAIGKGTAFTISLPR